MNIIEFYKKETFVPKIILATLTALIIISFIEFLNQEFGRTTEYFDLEPLS